MTLGGRDEADDESATGPGPDRPAARSVRSAGTNRRRQHGRGLQLTTIESGEACFGAPGEVVADRYEKFRKIGVFADSG